MSSESLRYEEEQARERQLNELEDLRRDIMKNRVDQFGERIGSIKGDVRARVRAIVEGDVNRNSPAVLEANDQKQALRTRQAELERQLELRRSAYDKMYCQREKGLAMFERWAERGLYSPKSPAREGSLAVLIGLTVVIVVIESILLRRPSEDLVRELFPEVGNATPWAMALVVGLVGLATASIVFAGQEWKRYHILQARAEIAGDDADHFVGSVTPTRAWLISIFAISMQVILFFVRFQLDTGSATTQGVSRAVSALVMLLAGSIAFVEYRRHHVEAQTKPIWDQEYLDEYSLLHREAYTDIPRDLVEVDRRKLSAYKLALHDHQRASTQLDDSEVMDAIHDLIDIQEERLSALPDHPFIKPPTPNCTKTEADTSEVLDRHLHADRENPEFARHNQTSEAELNGSSLPGQDVVDDPDLAAARLGELNLIGRLGWGGLGEVYRAHHLPSDSTVAVRLFESRRLVAGGRAQLRHLVSSLGSLAEEWPIAQVVRAGVVEDVAFVASEYLPTGTLEDLNQLSGPKAVADFLLPFAEAIRAAHLVGLRHGSLRSRSLRIDRFGHLVLVDLGVAQAQREVAVSEDVCGLLGLGSTVDGDQSLAELWQQTDQTLDELVAALHRYSGEPVADTQSKDEAQEVHR